MSDGPDVRAVYAREYRAVRERVSDLIAGASPEALATVAPATPKWSVQDVLAHMVGLCDDVLERRLDGVTTEPWTDAQVAARRGRRARDLLDEWARIGPPFEAHMGELPPVVAGQILFDAFTHEHDIRHALGVPGARDGAVLDLVFDWLIGVRALAGAAPLSFETEAGSFVTGEGEPVASVRASRFEVVRASTGRRCASEIASYGWDPAPDVAAIVAAPIFQLRDTPLDE